MVKQLIINPRSMQHILLLGVSTLGLSLSACRSRDEEPQRMYEPQQNNRKVDTPNKVVTRDVDQQENPLNQNPKINDETKPKTYNVFANGVTLENGWYDIDKQGTKEDVAACWLITASNMIQWWQDRYLERGYILPSGTPNGSSSSAYKSEIFDAGIRSFINLHYGADIKTGLAWYKDGEHLQVSNHAYPRMGTGGYLKTIENNLFEYSKRCFVSYDDWKDAAKDQQALRIFSRSLISKLKRGSIVGMDIKTHVDIGGILHAITLWGAEVDQEDNIVSLYITDSDDEEHRLVRCPVEVHTHNWYKYLEIAMNVPSQKTYNGRAKWAILRLYELACPPKQ